MLSSCSFVHGVGAGGILDLVSQLAKPKTTNLGSLLWTFILYYPGHRGQTNTKPSMLEALLSSGPPHRLIQDPHTVPDGACRGILIKTSSSEGLAGQAAWPRTLGAIPGQGGQGALLGAHIPKTNRSNKPALSSPFEDG